ASWCIRYTDRISLTDNPIVYLRYTTTTSQHFSPGSREQAQDSCSKARLWSDKRSNSYGLSEKQACGHEDQSEP
ncbi:MAG: hypothetical protein WBO18_16450, partial [Gammaproteobacteria bacterium]